jgi:sugar phosphate isomerase/epimerase
MLKAVFDLALHPCIVNWRVPWPGLAQLAAEVGYQGAVIPRNPPLTAEAVSNVPVPATAMQLPTEVRQDEATFEDTFSQLSDACKFAARAGCTVAPLGIPPSSDLPRAAQAQIYRDRLKKCCDVLDEYSIRLALECITPVHLRRAHPYEFLWRNAEMLDFGLSISPHAGLVVDAWHWHHAGADREWIREIPGDRILDVHIADGPAAAPAEVRDTERLLPGEGVIELQLFFQLLNEKGYAGPVTVELFGRGLSEMSPHRAARLTFETSQNLLADL